MRESARPCPAAPKQLVHPNEQLSRRYSAGRLLLPLMPADAAGVAQQHQRQRQKERQQQHWPMVMAFARSRLPDFGLELLLLLLRVRACESRPAAGCVRLWCGGGARAHTDARTKRRSVSRVTLAHTHAHTQTHT